MSRIAIIGGGITGAFLAYLLAKSGEHITLFDGKNDPYAATPCNPGGINPLHGPGIPGSMQKFFMYCYQTHEAIAQDLQLESGIDYHYKKIDRLFLAYNEDEVTNLRAARALYLNAPDFTANWLSAGEIVALDDRIKHDVKGGLLTFGNAVVDTALYCEALTTAASRYGAQIIQENIINLTLSPSRVTGVETSQGKITFDKVILANGHNSQAQLLQAGSSITVSPVKGQMLEVELDEKPFAFDITHGLTGCYIAPRGRYWWGGTRESTDTSPGVTAEGRAMLINGISEMLPGLKKFRIVAHKAGYRPSTRDGIPVAGLIPGYNNLYLCNGGGSKGVLVSAGMASVICDLILGNKLTFPQINPN